MLASIVLAFALTTAITTMQRAFLLLTSAHNLNFGTQIIENELEKVKLQGWDVVSAYPATATLTVDSRFTTNRRVGNRFTLTRTVGKVRGNNNLLQLTYTLTWRSAGRTLSRSYCSYYARYGTYDWLYNTT